ncbi:hypothetical protein [Fodinicola feengrottensis]|uniref:hypothetical protein n=1 Tax=Fodinicola feengrottensis TaxID=435914 RepID=UPI002442E031|nr:hypothetical protein [Fodinicola feengrottensis]
MSRGATARTPATRSAVKPKVASQGGRIGRPEVVHLITQGDREDVRASADRCRHRPGVVGEAGAHGGVGEDAGLMPRQHPRRQEVEARQVPLQQVDGHPKVELGGTVDHRQQVIDRTLPNQPAIGLNPRPDGKNPDVVETDRGEVGEVAAGRVRVEVQPAVEPPGRRYVVGAHPERTTGCTAA